MRYKNFEDFPEDIRTMIARHMFGDAPTEEGINEYLTLKIPALKDRTVLEVINLEGGEDEIREYLSRASAWL